MLQPMTETSRQFEGVELLAAEYNLNNIHPTKTLVKTLFKRASESIKFFSENKEIKDLSREEKRILVELRRILQECINAIDDRNSQIPRKQRARYKATLYKLMGEKYEVQYLESRQYRQDASRRAG
jgi:hypothetical protein